MVVVVCVLNRWPKLTTKTVTERNHNRLRVSIRSQQSRFVQRAACSVQRAACSNSGAVAKLSLCVVLDWLVVVMWGCDDVMW